MIKLKRVYEKYDEDDGFRILIDRLWPRGLSKEKAKIDIWLKEIAPSDGLRKYFGHKTEKWDEFKDKYRNELVNKQDEIDEIKKLENQHKIITLLYGAKDDRHNNAVVLKEIMENEK